MKKNENIKTFIELNKNEPELKLMDKLSGEIMNLKKGNRISLKYTFILSPWASSLFGFEIYNEQPYIGVPSEIYDSLMSTRIFLINYIKGQPGIFIVFSMGTEKNKRPVALRIGMRSKRVEALSKFKAVKLIRMDNDLMAEPGFQEDEFKLGIRNVKGLDWESFGKKNK